MRVAVVDMGTNSTRLLVAETDGSRLAELHRETRVTRLGRGVDTTGKLSDDAIGDVSAAVADYLETAADHSVSQVAAFTTSAARDADNGSAFLAELRERFGLEARVLDGGTEARLTYAGVTGGRSSPAPGPQLVADIGGGSTEIVIGDDDEVLFAESLDLGVVRHTERHINSDPPAPDELESLADAIRAEIERSRGRCQELSPQEGTAVAGTPSSLAAMSLGLEAYDSDAVEGHELRLGEIQQQLSKLASVPLEGRRALLGPAPERAPNIVAGTVILIGVMRGFGLERIRVSERDILWGAALEVGSAAA